MSKYSRRGFLRRVGAGAVAVGGAGALGPAPAAYGAEAPAGRYGRLFALPPFAQPTAKVRQALLELGARGGPMDAKDALEFGPKVLFLPEDYEELPDQLAADLNNRNNPTQTAGLTFVAQFVAHDLTFDSTSPLGAATAPAAATNARTPVLDLESVYGSGPLASTHLYDPADLAKLRVESGGLHEDLPRTADGTAICADPRNDVNAILAGLHGAFMLFHNRVVDYVRDRERGLDTVASFERARQETRQHYQWLVVNELLPLVAGRDVVADVLRRGRRFYTPKTPFIPVEFQAAAFRFGHSLVRPSYRLNFAGDRGEAFFGMIFDPAEEGKADPADLRGGVRAPRRFVDWQTFFDFNDGVVRQNKRTDTKISTPMFDIPLGAIPSRDAPTSLPQRDLLRHLTWGLPSGQAVAKRMKVRALAPHELPDVAQLGAGFERSTPLWYYVLREAEVYGEGLRLGPVGARIVAEVLLGVLQLDKSSYLAAKPAWKPTLATSTVEFLTFAGVDPKSRAA